MSVPIYLNAKTYQVFLTNNHDNTFFLHFSNSITESLISIPQYLEEKQAYLIKKGRCFNYKERRYTTYDYLKKEKIATILEAINKDSNNQGKK